MENWEAKNSMKAMAGERPSVAFTVSSGTGWKMSFPNDMHLSVDIGPKSNSDNIDKPRSASTLARGYVCESNTAEVVIWKDGMADDCPAQVFHQVFDDGPAPLPSDAGPSAAGVVGSGNRTVGIGEWKYNGPDGLDTDHRGRGHSARPSDVVGYASLYVVLEVIDYLKNLTAEEATVYDKAQ